MMIAAIEIVLVVIFGFLLLYLTALSFLALMARKQSVSQASRLRRMAVVVPAHNEELTIERTLLSLFAVDYPRDCYDVIVIADNCTDRTAERARVLGAKVNERQHPTLQGKGYALRWCFDLLSEQPGYEAFVVVDADTIVSSNLLKVMNSYLDNGAQAIQCSDLVEPQSGSWSREATRVGFMLYNYVRPLGRRQIGGSAGLRGNGMCIAADTLRQVPWRAYSLNEDVEYGLLLLLHGISVVFAPEAVVHAAMPKEAANAVTQRARWEVGKFPLIRRYAFPLVKATIGQKSFRPFDAFVDLVTPPFLNLIGLATLFMFASVILQTVNLGETAEFAWLWLILLALGAVHVFVGLSAVGADKSIYKALLFLPRYGFWKLTLYLRLMRGERTKKWIRTTRETALSHRQVSEGLKH
jgi:1,2-diacylglycerol 3-beta-glucosyltransferase